MTNGPKKGSRIQHRRLVGMILLIILALIIIGLAVAAGYGIYKWENGGKLNRETMFTVTAPPVVSMERTENPEADSEPAVEYDGKPAIEHMGKYYVMNEDVFCILFMGVDTNVEREEEIGLNSHQADSLILAAVNTNTRKLSMINIPRNSIGEVQEYDLQGNYVRTIQEPICTQYAYGSDVQSSCELTRDAMSNLLFGLPIHRYISINMDGLFMANDAIGGVTLELLDDMTAFNPAMEKGKTYTLTGKDAEIYVSRRLGQGLDGTNLSRVKRQVQYYKAFFSLAKERIKKEPTFALKLYQSMGSTLASDLSMDEVLYLSKEAVDMDMAEENITTLEGRADDETDDFFVDDAALKDLLIRVFYVEAKH